MKTDLIFRMQQEVKVLRENPSMAWRGHVSADLMDEAIRALASSPPPSSDITPERIGVIEEIAAERKRQVEHEGWTPEHDEQHGDFELSRAAMVYTRHAAYHHKSPHYAIMGAPDAWPWEYGWWRPKTPRRDLVRAAALIVAEIDRLDRLTAHERKTDE